MQTQPWWEPKPLGVISCFECRGLDSNCPELEKELCSIKPRRMKKIAPTYIEGMKKCSQHPLTQQIFWWTLSSGWTIREQSVIIWRGSRNYWWIIMRVKHQMRQSLMMVAQWRQLVGHPTVTMGKTNDYFFVCKVSFDLQASLCKFLYYIHAIWMVAHIKTWFVYTSNNQCCYCPLPAFLEKLHCKK